MTNRYLEKIAFSFFNSKPDPNQQEVSKLTNSLYYDADDLLTYHADKALDKANKIAKDNKWQLNSNSDDHSKYLGVIRNTLLNNKKLYSEFKGIHDVYSKKLEHLNTNLPSSLKPGGYKQFMDSHMDIKLQDY